MAPGRPRAAVRAELAAHGACRHELVEVEAHGREVQPDVRRELGRGPAGPLFGPFGLGQGVDQCAPHGRLEQGGHRIRLTTHERPPQRNGGHSSSVFGLTVAMRESFVSLIVSG